MAHLAEQFWVLTTRMNYLECPTQYQHSLARSSQVEQLFLCPRPCGLAQLVLVISSSWALRFIYWMKTPVDLLENVLHLYSNMSGLYRDFPPSTASCRRYYLSRSNVPIASAIAMAASLPLGSINPYSKSFILSRLLMGSQALVPFISAALRLIVQISWVGSTPIEATVSMAIRQVMILVKEAIYLFAKLFFSQTTSLFVRSQAIHAFALILPVSVLSVRQVFSL